MFRRVSLVATLLLLTVLVELAGPSTSEPLQQRPIYGFGVHVWPDDELDDFVQCGLTVFNLETEEHVWELPPLWIMVGDANTMRFLGVDGVDVRFSCEVNRERTEVSYSVAGTVGDQLVMNHLATVRFQ